MSDVIDRTGPVRAGEELDPERLGAYLREHLGEGELEVEQFPSGHSNLTYLVRWGGKDYVLRRPPFGSKVKSAHDMGREVRVLSALAGAEGEPPRFPAPRPILSCEDESVLGARFYLMERLRGVILRREPPPGLALDEATARRLCRSFVETLVDLHRLDYAAAGLGDLGRPDGFVERQVRGWAERYRKAQTDDVADVESVGAWLADNMPRSGAPALIHNDFKFDNIVLDPHDPTRVLGILDWEMATVGDPLMDLGTALCYWVEAGDPQPLRELRFGPTVLPGMMTRAELADVYGEQSGRDMSGIHFYYVFGLFKSAAVVQQIYYRFVQGHTRDARFGALIHAVRALAARAVSALDRGDIRPD